MYGIRWRTRFLCFQARIENQLIRFAQAARRAYKSVNSPHRRLHRALQLSSCFSVVVLCFRRRRSGVGDEEHSTDGYVTDNTDAYI